VDNLENDIKLDLEENVSNYVVWNFWLRIGITGELL
jgi:hypothetical protein